MSNTNGRIVWTKEDADRYASSPEALAANERILAIKDEDINFSDIPEWTNEQFAQARPAAEVFGDIFKDSGQE